MANSDEEQAADAKKPSTAQMPPPPQAPLEQSAADAAGRHADGDAGTNPPPHGDPSLEFDDDGDDCDGVPFDEADHADGPTLYEGGGDGGDGGGAVSASASAGASKKPPNPYIGKLVIAVRGRHQGSRGIVRAVGRGGWWTIDVVVGSAERGDVPASAAAAATATFEQQLEERAEGGGSAATAAAAVAAAAGEEPQRDAHVKDTPAPGVPASGRGSDTKDAVPSAAAAAAAVDAKADGPQAPPTPAAADAAVPSYRPTGVVIKVQNGQCRMLDPISVEEIDAYNEATGAWHSLIRPYRRTPTADGRTTANGGGDDVDAGFGTDDGDDDDDDDDGGVDGDDTGGRHQRDGGHTSRKRGRRRSANADAGGGGSSSSSSYYLHDDRLSSEDRDVLWKKLQPPDGCPPSWRDWRESVPPHVLERLAEASVPPPALRVAGSKMPRRSVVACTYDVIANDTTDGATKEGTKEDNKVYPVDSADGDQEEALPMSRPSPSDVATKLVVDPMASMSLPPVVLPSSSVDNDTTILSSVPKAVRHLPLESKVDIFDRKTGRVLSGQSAVSVRDLASVLRTHASYEPIVPPPAIEEAAAEAVAEAARRTAAIRQGRTAPNITVSANIEPQVRVRASAMEGREVIVTEGRLKGLVGKIEACLPGGWYVVSDLLDETELGVEHVVSSASLDLLESSEKSLESGTNVPRDSGGKVPSAKDLVDSFRSTIEKLYSNPIRQMNLRLEEMEKEKESIASYLGLDENGLVRDVEKTKAATGLHGLRIHQLQQRWEKLGKDIEGTKTKRIEYESAGEGIRNVAMQLLEMSHKPRA